MKKFTILLFIFFTILIPEGFAQFAADGSYFWNLTNITYSPNNKTEFVLANKDHYSNQIDHLDYLHVELIGYRKLSKNFSLGLGIRQTENYKSAQWNPGQTYMFYGVYVFNPGNVKIRFANRFITKTYKTSDTQYGLDNSTNVDFFVRSTNKLPKPYLMDELFSILHLGKIQTIRFYGGFHLLKKEHFGIDFYYCYLKNRPTWTWKDYSVWGINTKFRI